MKNKILQKTLIAGFTAGLAFCVTGADVVSVDRNIDPAVDEIVRHVIILDQFRDVIRLNIETAGSDADAKMLAEKIAQIVTSNVAKDDAIVGRQGNQDLKLIITPQLVLVDQDGDYYRMNCEVVLEIKSAASGRVFGSKLIQIVGSKRVLGRPAAVAQFTNDISQAAADWCRTEIKRIARAELNVAVLNVQLPGKRGKEARDASKDATYIREIGEQFKKMENLVTYELISKDSETGICQYRVAYFREAYPNGIDNAAEASMKNVVTHK